MRLYIDKGLIFSKNESMEKLSTELSLYESSLENLADDVSQESLNVILNKILASSVNVFGRISSTIRSSFGKLFKEPNKTELECYLSVNSKPVKQALSGSYDVVMDKMVPIPTGLRTSYKEAVEVVNSSVESINAKNVMKSSTDTLVRVVASISNEDSRYESMLKEKASGLVRSEKQVYDANRKLMSSITLERNGVKEVPFKQAYKTMKEFNDVHAEIVGFKSLYREVDDVTSFMDQSNQSAMSVIALAQTTETPLSKEFVRNMQLYVRYLANVLEAYGVATQNAMVLENNHILVLKNVIR